MTAHEFDQFLYFWHPQGAVGPGYGVQAKSKGITEGVLREIEPLCFFDPLSRSDPQVLTRRLLSTERVALLMKSSLRTPDGRFVIHGLVGKRELLQGAIAAEAIRSHSWVRVNQDLPPPATEMTRATVTAEITRPTIPDRPAYELLEQLISTGEVSFGTTFSDSLRTLAGLLPLMVGRSGFEVEYFVGERPSASELNRRPSDLEPPPSMATAQLHRTPMKVTTDEVRHAVRFISTTEASTDQLNDERVSLNFLAALEELVDSPEVSNNVQVWSRLSPDELAGALFDRRLREALIRDARRIDRSGSDLLTHCYHRVSRATFPIRCGKHLGAEFLGIARSADLHDQIRAASLAIHMSLVRFSTPVTDSAVDLAWLYTDQEVGVLEVLLRIDAGKLDFARLAEAIAGGQLTINGRLVSKLFALDVRDRFFSAIASSCGADPRVVELMRWSGDPVWALKVLARTYDSPRILRDYLAMSPGVGAEHLEAAFGDLAHIARFVLGDLPAVNLAIQHGIDNAMLYQRAAMREGGRKWRGR